MLRAIAGLKTELYEPHVFTWGNLFIFFGHRFSDGEIGFLEINSGSNPYQLYPLGCCDVRGDCPCPSSFTEPILDHSIKSSSFSFSHSVHATYIYQMLVMSKEHCSRRRLTRKLIKLNLLNPSFAQVSSKAMGGIFIMCSQGYTSSVVFAKVR